MFSVSWLSVGNIRFKSKVKRMEPSKVLFHFYIKISVDMHMFVTPLLLSAYSLQQLVVTLKLGCLAVFRTGSSLPVQQKNS